jgi:hypothetical protein
MLNFINLRQILRHLYICNHQRGWLLYILIPIPYGVISVFNDKCTPMACDVIFTFDIKYKCSPIRRCNLFTNNPLRDNIIQCGYTSTKEWLCCAVCRIEIQVNNHFFDNWNGPFTAMAVAAAGVCWWISLVQSGPSFVRRGSVREFPCSVGQSGFI